MVKKYARFTPFAWLRRLWRGAAAILARLARSWYGEREASSLTASLNEYNQVLQEHVRRDFYRPRRFRTDKDWRQWSGGDWRGRTIGDHEPDIKHLLDQRRVVVLGEPGAGKSTVAKAAIDEAIERKWLPILAVLRAFTGNLAATFIASPPETTPDATRLYVLDGLDEVPPEHLDKVVAAVDALLAGDQKARVLITSRQAFFSARDDLFQPPMPTYHLLDLNREDIDAFVQHMGVDRREFRSAWTTANVDLELTNPFALNALLTLFREKRRLPTTRSEAVRYVIDQFLEVPRARRHHRERRGLRMLAVAMETCARNELTERESVAVLAATLHIDDSDARQLLDALTLSVLIRTANGYAFQMRSYGEYLAAEELTEVLDVTRFLPLMRLEGSVELSDSWRNCVSYLAETHAGARRIFCLRNADWMLSSTPSSFAVSDRDVVVRGVLKQLKSRREYLVHHPVIRGRRVAAFLTDNTRQELLIALDSTDPVEAANALFLLGQSGEASIADRAYATGLDPAAMPLMRYSALAALDRVGRPDMIPGLLNISDWDDSAVSSRLDAAGSLVTPEYLRELLVALTRTETIITGAVVRLEEMEGDEYAQAAVTSLRQIPATAAASRMVSYVQPMFRAVMKHWKVEWAPVLARLTLDWNHGNGLDFVGDELIKIFSNSREAAVDVGRAILEELRSRPRRLSEVNPKAFSLVSLDDALAHALTKGDDHDLTRSLRAFGSNEVREALWNALPRDTTPSPEILEWQREEEERQKALAQSVEAVAQSEPTRTLGALAAVESSKWPELTPAQLEGLSQSVADRLEALDLATRIHWNAATVTLPRALPLLLEVIERYNVRLPSDVPLVLASRAGYYDAVAKYAKRFGLSDSATRLLEAQLEEPAAPEGMADALLRLVRALPTVSDRLLDAATAIAADGGRSDSLRSSAITVLTRHDAGGVYLRRLRGRLPARLEADAEDALIARQDRATIERRLAELINAPGKLDPEEADPPLNGNLSWLTKIRDTVHWKKLAQLRQISLERRLPNVAGSITQALEAMDGIKAAELVRRQIQHAPQEWEPFQRSHARRMDYEGRIRAAQAAPFDKVLQRLRKATTFRLLKVWAEGINDVPAWQAFVDRMPGDVVDDIAIRQVGGWGTILSDNFDPLTLSESADQQILVMDGDRARDFSKPNKPLRQDVRDAIGKLRNAGIDVHILNRYALENYFPRSAFEAVMGTGIGPHFPLDPDRAVAAQLPGYDKKMNCELAKNTTLEDLAGADLGQILDEIAERAGG